MIRRTSIAVVVILLLFTAPADAAPKGADSTVSGSIALADSGSVASISAGNVADLSYGNAVSFTTSVTGRVDAKATVSVTVICMQAGTMVYQWSAMPDFSFPLTDQAGQGLEWDGGAADCSASLVYRIKKGKSYSISVLDETNFAVAAG